MWPGGKRAAYINRPLRPPFRPAIQGVRDRVFGSRDSAAITGHFRGDSPRRTIDGFYSIAGETGLTQASRY